MIFSNVKSLTIPEGEVVKISNSFGVLWQKPSQGITLNCYDVETEQLLQVLKVEIPADGVLYFNNDTAPVLTGYDFVVMDGIKHSDIKSGDSFNAWYVSDTIPNRTLNRWVGYYQNNTTLTEVLINTYNANNCGSLFNGCSNLVKVRRFNTSNVKNLASAFHNCSSLTELPEMDTSNVTDMNYMCFLATKLSYIPPMDTSKVTKFTGCFRSCTALKTIEWGIDMSSCTDCNLMFSGAGIQSVKFKNVPSTLDLSGIGTKNYTVLNYI